MPNSPELKPENMEYGDLEKAVGTARNGGEIKKLITEIEERTKIPSHEEINTAFEGGDNATRTEIATGLLKRVFDRAGITSFGSKFTHIPSPVEIRTDDLAVEYKAFNGEGKGKEGEPQFYVTEVWDEVKPPSWKLWGNRKAETVRTNEAVVTVKLNNDPENPDNNTVLVAVLRHEGGKIEIGNYIKKDKNGNLVSSEAMAGMFDVMSETEYLRRLRGDDNPNTPATNETAYTAKVLRGELSTKRYKEEFKLKHNQSYEKFNMERDRRLTNADAHWRSKEIVPKLLDSLQKNYETLLQESRERQKEIRRQVKEEQSAFEEGVEKQVSSFIATIEKYGGKVKPDVKEKIGSDFRKKAEAERRRRKREEDDEKKKRSTGAFIR